MMVNTIPSFSHRNLPWKYGSTNQKAKGREVITTKKGTTRGEIPIDEKPPRALSVLETANAHTKKAKFDPRRMLLGL